MEQRPPKPDITGLLRAAQSGDRAAAEELFPLVYEELRALARRERRRWHGDLTMNATAMVHEAYLKLVDRHELPPENRNHFFAVAAKAMRHILCNYARDRRRLKRGGAAEHVPIDEGLNAISIELSDADADELAALDEALDRLDRANHRQREVVECRFFGGLTIEETASALRLSPATVKRDWTLARAWLFREIRRVRTSSS